MCGNFGIIDSNIESKKEILLRMSRVLQHRGPDGTGIQYFDDCALGHTRLTVIDLISGDQPMLSLDGKVGLTFNGEIYGYKAIKAQTNYSFNKSSTIVQFLCHVNVNITIKKVFCTKHWL